MNTILEAMYNLKEGVEFDDEDSLADLSYEFLCNHYNREIAKAIWEKLNKETKDWWFENYKEQFEDDEGYDENSQPSEEEVFQYFYDDGNLDPSGVVEYIADNEKDLIDLAEQNGFDYADPKKDQREEAINELVKRSGLSREEVIKIVSKIK